MPEIRYITLENAITVHKLTVEVSGGGSDGVLDTGKLASVLDHIQNDDYYPDFVDKLTHLFFSANKFHCFQDGNKRIAITLCAEMLLINGYLYCVQSFLRSMENISYHVAAGNIDKDLLRSIIESIILQEYEENEELKLRIWQAIRDGIEVDEEPGL